MLQIDLKTVVSQAAALGSDLRSEAALAAQESKTKWTAAESKYGSEVIGGIQHTVFTTIRGNGDFAELVRVSCIFALGRYDWEAARLNAAEGEKVDGTDHRYLLGAAKDVHDFLVAKLVKPAIRKAANGDTYLGIPLGPNDANFNTAYLIDAVRQGRIEAALDAANEKRRLAALDEAEADKVMGNLTTLVTESSSAGLADVLVVSCRCPRGYDWDKAKDTSGRFLSGSEALLGGAPAIVFARLKAAGLNPDVQDRGAHCGDPGCYYVVIPTPAA